VLPTKWTYLYRAFDSEGSTIDFLLSPQRERVAAKYLWPDVLQALEPALPAPSHLSDYEGFKRQHSRFLLYEPDARVLHRLL